MSFSNIIKKKNRLLLPFSWLYHIGVRIFGFFYDSGIKKSTRFSAPIICVGNLSVGGTGKSPMVEYLIRLLKNRYKLATVSRGYGRKTKGFLIATEKSTAAEIGDEPMQFYKGFPDVLVSVGEKRVEAVERLMQNEKPDVIILDDAFQHRAITAGFNILLTEFNNPFFSDYYLPAGQLRDLKANYKRANIIVVTKSPGNLTKENAAAFIAQLKPINNQVVFFASIKYGDAKALFSQNTLELNSITEIILVTGIANPQPFYNYLRGFRKKITPFYFPDHHNFQEADVERFLEVYNKEGKDKRVIVTTEKDAVRLQQLRNLLAEVAIYSIPIQHNFLFGESEKFNILIKEYIKSVEKQQ